MENIVKITVGIIAIGAIILVSWWSISKMVSLISKIELEPQKSSAEINAEKRDECLENGFDYEFVNEFMYVGVRCKKLEDN